MNLIEFLSAYSLSDGKIISFIIKYDNNCVDIFLQIKRSILRNKYKPSKIKLIFEEVVRVDLVEDFSTGHDYSDCTLSQLENGNFYLENGNFYLSLDPYDNSGIPNVDDNFKVISKNLMIIDDETNESITIT